jgi:S-adenosylmethionine uptake transporter
MNRLDSPSPLIPFLVACLSIAIYSSMDVLMKGLSISIGAYNAVIWRTAVGSVLTGLVYATTRPTWPSKALMRLHILRAIIVAAMAIFFFWGLARLPMAEAISLAFIAPLLAIFLAAILLKEKIERRAIGAAILGFAGVLVIVTGKVGGDHAEGALWAVGSIFLSALCYAYNLILGRQLAQATTPMEIAFYQNLFVTLVLAVAAPWLLILPSADHAPQIFGAAALASVSILLLSWAYARAETQILATTEYTGFLWAMLYGWIFFHEPVTLSTVAGAALIVGACLFVTRRPANKVSPSAAPPDPIAP